jgi:trehalose utilization protein
MAMSNKLRVTVWNEFVHEKEHDAVRAVYPEGIHTVLARALEERGGVQVRTATLEEPEHGLTEGVVQNTEVLIWWGHMAHEKVEDEIVSRVHERVLSGMGLIVLHSGHFSKIFKVLMGTSCSLKWRDEGERERLWVVDPSHPIAEGIDGCIELERAEMYGEPFRIPPPDEIVFISWFLGGEVFRSGCTWKRQHGKVFYFRPGHETFPVYRNEQILRVIHNAVRWAAPKVFLDGSDCENVKEPLERR